MWIIRDMNTNKKLAAFDSYTEASEWMFNHPPRPGKCHWLKHED